MTVRAWIPVPIFARELGISKDGIYRDIRRGTFPFRTETISGRLHVNARDAGLITDNANEETREGDQSVTTAAPAHA